MAEDEKVDMGSLTQREILLLINDRVARIDLQIRAYEKDNIELKLKVNTLETKLKLWAAIIAIVSSGAVSLLIHFITNSK